MIAFAGRVLRELALFMLLAVAYYAVIGPLAMVRSLRPGRSVTRTDTYWSPRR